MNHRPYLIPPAARFATSSFRFSWRCIWWRRILQPPRKMPRRLLMRFSGMSRLLPITTQGRALHQNRESRTRCTRSNRNSWGGGKTGGVEAVGFRRWESILLRTSIPIANLTLQVLCNVSEPHREEQQRNQAEVHSGHDESAARRHLEVAALFITLLAKQEPQSGQRQNEDQADKKVRVQHQQH